MIKDFYFNLGFWHEKWVKEFFYAAHKSIEEVI
jgi:hypothetical protein